MTVEVESYLNELDRTRPYFKLWGTRGSTPVSGSRFVRHGGNTVCMEVCVGTDRVVFDAGTGIRELGVQLAKKRDPIHLFIGHTHWDHIQGFPFFIPAYMSKQSVFVYGAPAFGKNLRSIFRGQLDYEYFPVQLEDMHASLHFINLVEKTIFIGSLAVSWEYVDHPCDAICFKIKTPTKTIAYITDNEFLKGYLGPPDLESAGDRITPYTRLIEFLQGVDILIAEGQYSNSEYKRKIGWGHSSISNACLLCKLSKVKRWIVIHHDPMHDDEFLAEKLAITRLILEEIEYPIPVEHAFDGLSEFL